MIPFLLTGMLNLVAPAEAGDGQITLLITNATAVAKQEKGNAVVTVASVFMDIDKKTQKVIAQRMADSLTAEGVQATIVPQTITFPSPGYTSFYLWDPTVSALQPVTLAMGEYRVLQVNVLNVDDLVASSTNGVVVDLAHMFGYNLKAAVNERAAPVLLAQLESQGVHAVAAW